MTILNKWRINRLDLMIKSSLNGISLSQCYYGVMRDSWIGKGARENLVSRCMSGYVSRGLS